MPKTKPSERKKIILACIILFLANILSTGFLAISHDKAANDRLEYYMISENLASGKGFSCYAKTDVHSPVTRAPYPGEERFGYPFIVSLFFRVLGPSIVLANFVSALFKSLTAVAMFLVGERLFDFRVAFLAVVLYSLNPFFTYVGILNLTDTAFNFFYYAGLFCGLAYLMDGKRLHIFLSGVFSAVCFVVRMEGLILVGFVAFMVFAKAMRQKKNKEDLIMFLSPFIIVFGLKLIYNLTTFGSMFYSSRVDTFIPDWEYKYSLKELSLGQYFDAIGGVLGWFWVRWHNLAGFYVNGVAKGLLWPETLYAFMPVLMVVPLVFGIAYLLLRKGELGRTKPRYIAYTAVLLALQIIALLLYEGFPFSGGGFIPRNWEITFPFIMFLMSLGLIKLWDSQWLGDIKRLGSMSSTKRLLKYALKILAAFLVVNYLIYSYNGNSKVIEDFIMSPPYTGAVIQGALWVKDNIPGNAVLMSRKSPQASYFSGKPAVMIPNDPPEDILAYAKEHGVTHFIITVDERESRRELADLIETRPDILKTVYVGYIKSGDELHEDYRIVAIEKYAL